jgi:Tol biopolymer transport system component
MRRPWQALAALCVLTLAVTLCGCGSSGGPNGPSVDTAGKGGGKPPAPPPPPTPSKLVYWDMQWKPTQHGSIYTAYTNGTGVAKVADDGSYPCWSPLLESGLYICANLPGGLWRMRDDGTTPQLLTDSGWYAQWSPDGSRIVFTTWDAIKLVPAGGGPVTQLTTALPNGRDDSPAWSPSGDYVVFFRSGAGGTGLTVVPATGGEPYPVVPDYDPESPTWGGDPDWSTDNRIAYAGNGGISYIEVDSQGHYTSGPVLLYANRLASHPSWSPDAKQLAFDIEEWTTNGRATSTIYVMDVATKQITSSFPGWQPDWSPPVFGG